MDWINEEHQERCKGRHKPLLPSQHEEVNARYSGRTLEYCCDCGQPTGRAGRGEDSLYTENDEGPFCWECFPEND